MTMLLSMHIILMTASLAATAGMALAALASLKVDAAFIRANIVVTTLGTFCGIGLLLIEPVGVKCIALAGYVALFALAYRFVVRRNQSLAASSAA